MKYKIKSKKQVYLAILLSYCFFFSSFTNADLDYYIGRWGYIKTYDPNIQDDVQTVNSNVFTVELKVNPNSRKYKHENSAIVGVLHQQHHFNIIFLHIFFTCSILLNSLHVHI